MLGDPGPVPDFLVRPDPGDDDWRRFFAHGRDRPIKMPKPRIQTPEELMQRHPDGQLWPRHPEEASIADGEGGLNPSWKTHRAPNLVHGLADFKPESGGLAAALSPTGRSTEERLAVNDIKSPKGKVVLTAMSTSRGALTEKGKAPAAAPVEALLADAKKKGYKEQPYPNGGVRVMRIKNFLRNWDKKAAR